MQRNRRESLAFWLAAALLVSIAVLALGAAVTWTLRSATPPATPRPTLAPLVIPTLSDPFTPAHRRGPAATPTRTVQRRTWCPECAAAGQPANVWSDAAMSRVVCRLAWNAPVAVLDELGGMALVSGSGCRGWMRTSLLR